jgi:endo-1,3(4)-beta-glucanase
MKQESSSEDYNLAYAIQLYGKATSNDELQALGTLMGAINARSIQSYMLLGPENEVQPAIYNMNYVSGILFANKMVHSTFFGGQTQFVHGIHMLPLTPMSPFVRKASFVANEWRDVLASLAGSLTDNWAGILHSNLAISDPAASWRFFANGNVNKFNYDFLDDGQTLTWALFFAASQGGGI